jgi:hypothetical protein
MERRQRLWRLREVWPLIAPATPAKQRGRSRTQRDAARPDTPRQLTLAWAEALATPDPAVPNSAPPPLPALDAEARAALDYTLLGMSSRPHPLRALRRDLRRRGVRTIAELAELPAGQVTQAAGWVISTQRLPPDCFFDTFTSHPTPSPSASYWVAPDRGNGSGLFADIPATTDENSRHGALPLGREAAVCAQRLGGDTPDDAPFEGGTVTGLRRRVRRLSILRRLV